MEQNTNKLSKDDKERLDFVKYWAEWVKTHPDKEWSRAQNVLINSQIKG
jgi:hypothetical protein